MTARSQAERGGNTTKPKRLSHSQLKVLHNYAIGKDPRSHLVGASQHGGYWQTHWSLHKNGMVKGLPETMGELTLLGCIEHRAWCCKKGKTPDDFKVEEVELALRQEELK